MNSRKLLFRVILIVTAVCLFSAPVGAYIGPGAGLSAIGTFLALVAGIILAIFGFLWYPIKRLYRFMTKNSEKNEEGGPNEWFSG
jgi:hypothetical protein